MVDHHHLHAQLFGQPHLVGIVDTTVDGHEQGRLFRCDSLYRDARQAIALLEAARQVPVDFGSHGPQTEHQKSRGGNAVGIVVSMDHDLSPTVYRRAECADGSVHV